MTEEKVFDPIDVTIKNIAAKQAGDVMDQEDLEQELWVFYLDEVSPRNYHDGEAKTLLRKQATKVVRNERIDYMHFRGAFIYNPAVVRRILAEATWCEVHEAFDIEGRVDVTNAMHELSREKQRLLYRRYCLGDRLDGAEQKSMERAVDAIANILNGAGPAHEVELEVAAEELYCY